MPIEVKLPVLKDESNEDQPVEEVTISFWYADAGEKVNEGDELLQVRTDKATFDVPSPASGKLVSVLVKEEEKAKPGDVVALIEEVWQG